MSRAPNTNHLSSGPSWSQDAARQPSVGALEMIKWSPLERRHQSSRVAVLSYSAHTAGCMLKAQSRGRMERGPESGLKNCLRSLPGPPSSAYSFKPPRAYDRECPGVCVWLCFYLTENLPKTRATLCFGYLSRNRQTRRGAERECCQLFLALALARI